MIAEELDGNVIDLEGNELVAVELGHTDTDHTTCLNVPSIGLVVAGDAAYNDVHLYLAESDAGGRRSWLTALDTIEKLSPRAVVAGHKRPEARDDEAERILNGTRSYIQDFAAAVSSSGTVEQIVGVMRSKYPDHGNLTTFLFSASAAATHLACPGCCPGYARLSSNRGSAEHPGLNAVKAST